MLASGFIVHGEFTSIYMRDSSARAAGAFLVTLLFVLLSILPVVPVASVWKYSLKIALVVLGANVLGWMIYRAGQGTSPTG